ncbi:AlbA family DNA-binding domain-containing protein [Nocardia gipuzkoensis]
MEFTALHHQLGRAPGPITEEMIDDAITRGIKETSDLDWKQKLPAIKELAQSDYVKDAAAMANSGGGIIVYGIEETDKAATGRVDCGQEVDENYERTLSRLAVAKIHPPVFGVKVVRLGTPQQRCTAVVIPASVDGPHLIYRNELYFGAPVRNGADTEWMNERQIEAMYRARFDERRHAAEALTNPYNELADQLSTTSNAYLIAVAHPRITAVTPSRPDRDQARTLFRLGAQQSLEYARRQPGVHAFDNIDVDQPRPGLRRWIAPATAAAQRDEWRRAQASIHHDGSITLTAAVGGHPRPARSEIDDGGVINSSTIECLVADLLGLVREISRHLTTTEYEIRIGIEWDGETPLIIQTVDNHGFPFAENSHRLARYSPVEATIDVGADHAAFEQQVRELALDCVNQGGVTYLKAITITAPA